MSPSLITVFKSSRSELTLEPSQNIVNGDIQIAARSGRSFSV